MGLGQRLGGRSGAVSAECAAYGRLKQDRHSNRCKRGDHRHKNRDDADILIALFMGEPDDGEHRDDSAAMRQGIKAAAGHCDQSVKLFGRDAHGEILVSKSRHEDLQTT